MEQKRHEAVLGFEQPLTPAQLKQNQDLQDEIERLPRMLRFPFRKRYENIYEEKGLLEAHKYLYFKFYGKYSRELMPLMTAFRCVIWISLMHCRSYPTRPLNYWQSNWRKYF